MAKKNIIALDSVVPTDAPTVAVETQVDVVPVQPEVEVQVEKKPRNMDKVREARHAITETARLLTERVIKGELVFEKVQNHKNQMKCKNKDTGNYLLLTLVETESNNPRHESGKKSRVNLVAYSADKIAISDVMNGRDIWDHYHPVVKPTKERKAKAEKSSHVRGADLSAMF